MKTSIRVAFTVFAVGLLSACGTVPQKDIEFNPLSFKTSSRIGVAMTALPKVDLSLPGADCLLCIAVATAMNSSLNTYTQSLSHEDLPQLKAQLVQALAKKGQPALVIDEPLDVKSLPDSSSKEPNIATKDYSGLKAKYNIDKVLVVNISALGIQRPFSSYVPKGAPTAYLNGTGYLINLANNNYEWYKPVQVARAADGAWDEAPKFPGLTNAYFQTLELGKDAFLKSFSE
jgi:hypothetical protein